VLAGAQQLHLQTPKLVLRMGVPKRRVSALVHPRMAPELAAARPMFAASAHQKRVAEMEVAELPAVVLQR